MPSQKSNFLTIYIYTHHIHHSFVKMKAAAGCTDHFNGFLPVTRGYCTKRKTNRRRKQDERIK